MTTILDSIKFKLGLAIKAKDESTKNALRSLLSKVQNSGQENDEAVISAAKTLIKQNEEEIDSRQGNVKMADGTIKTFKVADHSEQIELIKKQNIVLESFLPSYLSKDNIEGILSEKIDLLKSAKNVGAATGIAMKILKEVGPVEGTTVKEVVSKLYG